jgi:hypothetical protein
VRFGSDYGRLVQAAFQVGVPPDPAGPLAGAYVGPDGAAAADRTGPVLAASFGEGCRAAGG